jgi:hypothetical protein
MQWWLVSIALTLSLSTYCSLALACSQQILTLLQLLLPLLLLLLLPLQDDDQGVRCAAAKTCGHCLPHTTNTSSTTAIPTRYIGLRAVEEAHQRLSQLARVSPAAAEAYRLGLLETATGAGAGAAAALRYTMLTLL